jgi:hypothetical protein
VPKTVSPRMALARLPDAELVRTYVWEKPIRAAHWLIFFAFASLSITGLYLHHPYFSAATTSAFLMAKMRFAHELSGFVLIAAILLRAYWFFGSEQEFVGTRILGCFPEYQEFGLGHGHALGLQEQVVQVLVAATAA